MIRLSNSIEQVAAFETVAADMKGLLATANVAHTRNNPLQYGVTEININTTNPTPNNADGLGTQRRREKFGT